MLGMVAYICNLSTEKAKGVGSGVQGHLQLPAKFHQLELPESLPRCVKYLL